MSSLILLHCAFLSFSQTSRVRSYPSATSTLTPTDSQSIYTVHLEHVSSAECRVSPLWTSMEFYSHDTPALHSLTVYHAIYYVTFVFTLYITDLTWNAKQKTWNKTWVTRQLYLFLCVFVSDFSKYPCFLPHQKNLILSFRYTPAIAATGISRSSSAVERLHPSLR